MDSIQFEVIYPPLNADPSEEDDVPYPEIRIIINGRDLRDMVREVELPLRAAEGHPDRAGGYIGLPPEVLRSKHFLGQAESIYRHLEEDRRPNRAALFVCECGEPGCWPLVATISVTDDRVVWGEFRQPHRKTWKYETLGPFTFSRPQYEDAIHHSASLSGDPEA